MLIVSKDLKVVENTKSKTILPSEIKIISDTEFTQSDKMIVDIVGLYSPDLDFNHCYCYFKDDLSNDFNPILEILKVSGFDVKIADNELISELANDIAILFDILIENLKSSRDIKKIYESALKDGYFDECLSKYNLDRKNLKYKREHKESFLNVIFPEINIKFEFFFAIADLFKIWGKNHQNIILESELNQFRVLKFKKPISLYVYINGFLKELKVSLSDCFYRLQPLDKSLNGNAKSLGLNQSKIDIKNDDLARKLGLNNGIEVVENFSKLSSNFPDLAAMYNAQDIFLSDLVSVEQQKLLDRLRHDFKLESSLIADTTGSTVSKFIKDLILKEFDICETDSDKNKIISEQFSLTKIKNLQEIPLNDFGIQPFLTVGGLLFSRTPNNPIIKGKLSDCDLSSCYASFMSTMNIYLGEPVVRTFKHKKYKPKLREVIEFIKSQKLNRDAWFLRVSGELKTAFNTLIMSDLRFVNKAILNPSVKDLNPSKKSVELFNAFKTPKKQATSTLLLKEIKFGLINADIIDCLSLLPNNWYEDYLELFVDAIIFFPNELIANSLDELELIKSNLPDESYIESFNSKSGIKNIELQYYKNNACLKFDIGKYWKELKSKRSEYKKAKNPVQEIFKLVGNSGYGVLACLHLATNNLVASNSITAGARCAAWLMTNCLNGFSPITDGTSFSWNNIPIGYKFKDLLLENNQYLFNYDSNIKSNMSDSDINNWIDKGVMNQNFLNHLYSFYEVDKTHIPSNRYGFELKTERFNSFDNKSVESVFFSNYYNSNAGNYSKGLDDSILLIDNSDYDFNEQNNYIKARSFNGKNETLINWYINSIGKKYISPIIYSENKIMKFSDGNIMAIRLLESEKIESIAHPMGFSTKGYKMMKLISRSQFLFLNESQLKNFETNEIKLSELSNHIFDKKFWENLSSDDLKDFDIKLNHEIDYYKFSKTHSVGVGFELLALSRTHKGSIESVRNLIFDKILENCNDFNAGLNINRNFKLADNFKYLLASVIVLKANAEYKLVECLKASANEPTILTLNKENIKTLSSIWNCLEE